LSLLYFPYLPVPAILDEDKKEYKKTDEQKKKWDERADEHAKKAQQRKKYLEENPTGISEVEKQKIRDEKKKLSREIEKDKLEAEKFKPTVDYATRREQRIAINKEKSDMTTDSWEELLTIYLDAIKNQDSIRAAAAYLKATEYGNENEFQNALSYDSDAEGMKQMIEDEFEGKLGMEHELAMTIANDASYIGEKGFHWGVARKVKIDKLGAQVWKDEEERQMEVLAEVRKLDFENFMRRANRLAYGTEKVRGATKEERIMNFSETGARDFHLNDFGKTFIAENFDKFQPLITRGRFNINLGVKISGGDNPRLLRQLADLTDNPQGYTRMLDTIAEKAHVKEDEFGMYKKVFQMMSGR